MMTSTIRKTTDTSRQQLIKKHTTLIHSDNIKEVSHVQRQDGDWIL